MIGLGSLPNLGMGMLQQGANPMQAAPQGMAMQPQMIQALQSRMGQGAGQMGGMQQALNPMLQAMMTRGIGPGMARSPLMSGPYGDILAKLRSQVMQGGAALPQPMQPTPGGYSGFGSTMQGGMGSAQPMQPAPAGMSGASSMLTPQMMQQLAARMFGR